MVTEETHMVGSAQVPSAPGVRYAGTFPNLRVVSLEEHVSFPDLASRIDNALLVKRGYPPSDAPSARPAIDEALADFGARRLEAMDAAGIAVQVISLSGPGAELLPGDEGAVLAREINDRLADRVGRNPRRFAAFAHLPLGAPEAAAGELERAVRELGFVGAMVNGGTDGVFLDDPRFEPVLACAEVLGVPIYVHPGIPAQPVRDAYYGRLAAPIAGIFARSGWGWHAETAVQILRLVLSGSLDRHPKLQLVVGHLGEGLPAMFDRFDETFAFASPKFLERSVVQTILDHVHVTCSGFYHKPTFTMLLETFGADRILFSVDYPFSSAKTARTFLDTIYVSPSDREKIAHGNADALLKLKVTT